MSFKKTVSELFQQSADKNAIMPSERVWEQVAARLDKQARPTGISRLRSVLRAAAAIMLLGVLVWGANSVSSHRQQLSASPVALEDITPSVASVTIAMEQVALSRHYPQLPRIHEGAALQRIVPKVVLQ
jgi:hypothetical protein